MCRLIELNGWSLRRVKGSHHIYSESGERKVISIPVLPRLPRRKNCRDLQSQPILD
ncbi:MAG: type II toxin-antitoxin system HicA family toxin [Bryobacteraceae bacterium]